MPAYSLERVCIRLICCDSLQASTALVEPTLFTEMVAMTGSGLELAMMLFLEERGKKGRRPGVAPPAAKEKCWSLYIYLVFLSSFLPLFEACIINMD